MVFPVSGALLLLLPAPPVYPAIYIITTDMLSVYLACVNASKQYVNSPISAMNTRAASCLHGAVTYTIPIVTFIESIEGEPL